VDHDGRRNAMTASFFSEVAHHPTALWVSIAQTSFTHELLMAAGRFSLIVLHDGQKDYAISCGTSSGREADKCAALPLYRTAGDAWYLDGAYASITCRVRSSTPVSDHTLFIADILAGEVDSRASIHRHLLTTDLL
jgi:flavin reductase (DIM6/NTAB) family NADH-FMN oxidoreductase RutF